MLNTLTFFFFFFEIHNLNVVISEIGGNKGRKKNSYTNYDFLSFNFSNGCLLIMSCHLSYESREQKNCKDLHMWNYSLCTSISCNPVCLLHLSPNLNEFQLIHGFDFIQQFYLFLRTYNLCLIQI